MSARLLRSTPMLGLLPVGNSATSVPIRWPGTRTPPGGGRPPPPPPPPPRNCCCRVRVSVELPVQLAEQQLPGGQAW